MRDLSGAELEQWAGLCSTGERFCFFQSPPFVQECGDSDAQLLMVRQEGRLVCALPFIIDASHGARLFALPGAPITQYNDLPICCQVDHKAVVQALYRAIVELGVDGIKLERIPENSSLFELEALVNARTNPQQALSIDLRELKAPEPRGNASNKRLLRKKRKLQELGKVGYAAFPAGEAPEGWVDKAIAIKQQWLAEKGDTSRLFSNPEAVEHLRHIFKTKGGAGWLFALTLDEKPVAVHLVFVTPRAHHLYFTVYETEHHRHSPSALLTYYQIEWSIERGLQLFDFMPPAFDYKRDWADGELTVWDAFVPLTMKGKLSLDYLMMIFKPTIRRVFERLPDGLRKQIVARIG